MVYMLKYVDNLIHFTKKSSAAREKSSKVLLVTYHTFLTNKTSFLHFIVSEQDIHVMSISLRMKNTSF